MLEDNFMFDMSKSISLNNNDFYQKFITLVILGFVITMPLKANTNSIFLISLFLLSLLNYKIFFEFKLHLKDKTVLVTLIFYLLHVLSVINSYNIHLATKELILKLPLFLVPIICKTIPWNKRLIFLVLYAYLGTMIVLAVYSFTFNYYEFFKNDLFSFENLKNNDWAYFFFMLPSVIGFHAPYFSLYIGLAIFIAIYLSFFSKAGNVFSKSLFVIILLFLFFFLAALSSRTALLATALLCLVWVIDYLYKRKNYSHIFLFLFICIVTLTTAFMEVPYLRGKMENRSGYSTRYYTWAASKNIIKENFVLGTGTGDIKDALRIEYSKLGFHEGLESMYNAHNQYLQTGIALGITGVLLLLGMLGFGIVEAIKKQNILLFSFILLFSICCLTESLLSRQNGVILFSFFYFFLPMLNKDYFKKTSYIL